MTSAFSRLVLLMGALPAVALAQTPRTAAPLRDKEGPRIEEVERGFHLGFAAGAHLVMNPPAASGTPRPFSAGQSVRVELGLDIGDRLSIDLFALGSANRAGAEYVGFSNRAASGDFSSLIPGASLRLYLLGIPDGQQVTRFWVYVRGGAGFVSWAPSNLIPNDQNGLVVFGGGGVDYFTRLRHFSIGLEVTASYLLPSSTLGIGVLPTLRYAF